MKDLEFYAITIFGENSKKEILAISYKNKIKHIYTLNVEGDLENKHVIKYHEKTSRIVSRLKARKNTELEKIDVSQALTKALFATRQSIALSIFRKLRSYVREE